MRCHRTPGLTRAHHATPGSRWGRYRGSTGPCRFLSTCLWCSANSLAGMSGLGVKIRQQTLARWGQLLPCSNRRDSADIHDPPCRNAGHQYMRRAGHAENQRPDRQPVRAGIQQRERDIGRVKVQASLLPPTVRSRTVAQIRQQRSVGVHLTVHLEIRFTLPDQRKRGAHFAGAGAVAGAGRRVRYQRHLRPMSANFLNRTALPSITGLLARAPISPRPSTAVPLDMTATRLPRAV